MDFSLGELLFGVGGLLAGLGAFIAFMRVAQLMEEMSSRFGTKKEKTKNDEDQV
ncbi:MAG: hypothetical protein ACLFO3_04700 [Candidatus Acetothermia bacterium]